MGAVFFRARAQRRGRRAATAGLAVLVAVATAAVLAALAGARRTDSAMDRFLAHNRPATVEVGGNVDFDAVRGLPQVASGDQGAFVLVVPPMASGQGPDIDRFGSLNAVVPLHGAEWTEMDRPSIVAGRHPRPDRPDEVAVSEGVARRLHLRPGTPLTVYAYAPEQLDDTSGEHGPVAPRGPAVALTVTGIERQPFDVQPPVNQDVVNLGQEWLYLTPAFWRDHGDAVATFGVGMSFRLRNGPADIDAFAAAVQQVPGGRDAEVEAASDSLEAARTARDATHVEAVALYLFAGFAGAVVLFLLAQSLRRQALADAIDRPALQASGMTGWQVRAAFALGTVPAAVCGAVAGACIGVLASPLMPFGVGRRAEIHPGIAVDVPVLLAGTVGAFVVVVAAAFTAAPSAAWLRLPEAPRLSRLGARLLALGVPLACGARFVFGGGRGRARSSAGTVLTGVVVAVAAVATTVTFGDSLGRLVATPRFQGWNWDVSVGNPRSPEDLDRTRDLLRANPMVGTYSAVLGTDEPISVGAHDTRAAALSGSVFPPVLEGRPPQVDDEVALGSATLRRTGRTVGQTVTVQGLDGSAPYRIVARVEIPASVIDSASMGEGALFTPSGLERVAGELEPVTTLVRYVPGTDREAAFARLRQDHGRTVVRPLTPTSVGNLAQVRRLPYVLAALLVAVALASLGHTLATSVRDHRRHLAILKSLGFGRRQVWATVTGQAIVIVIVALPVALPLGLAAGRWAWLLLAERLGTQAGPVVPLGLVALTTPLAVIAAIVIAAPPARRAARLRPGPVLRAE